MHESPTGNGLASGKNFILTAVLGNYQGQQYPLKADHETVIGRTEEADIMFNDGTVSRRHAKVIVQGEDVFVEDLGSTNGVFVAGTKVTRAKVKLGDLIVIGANMVNIGLQASGPAMRVATAGAEPSGPMIRLASPEVGSAGPSIRIASPGAEPTPIPIAPMKVNGYTSMSGMLDQIPLSDLIQLLATSGKSGVLEVKQEDEVGRIYLRDGHIEYGSIEDCPKMAPKKALFRMMLWKQGTFELHPPSSETFEPKITEPPDMLLLEAMRQDDEHSRILGEKPELNTVLSVSGALDKPLHTLPANHLNIVQLILSHRKVRKILYHSPLPDYETYRILIELIRDGFVIEEPAVIENSPLRLFKAR
jgi:hypothetical protein